MGNPDNLKDKIAALPESPGVYIFKDRGGKIIYIGKAKSLKKRVQSYFSRFLSAKTQALVSNIVDIEYKLCQTESIALLLEANLIHKNKPKYNISLRDDKSFPLVKITNEEFPAICVTRKKEADGARYFGPYTSAKILRQALKIIRRAFPYRTCKQLPKKACIYYRLGLSPAPCIGKINQEDYNKLINNISLILEGKADALIQSLSCEMISKSKSLQFEEAAKARDQINALSVFGEGKIEKSGFTELEDLKSLLGLSKIPERIEAFDISNISGKEATGAMVSFYKGFPDKNKYRRFRIKTTNEIDDYGMLKEVVGRRYLRLKKENLILPDLIIIDGGRSHLMVARAEIKKLGLHIPLASIAKEKENIYVLDRVRPIRLKSDTPALNLIRRARDEAHRFAVAYHHILRRKKIIGK